MAHKRQTGLGGQLFAQHLTQGLTWGTGTNEVSPACPPLTPLGLCTCLWMPFSHCFFWLTPPWLKVPLSGSLPGFLSHSRFTNHLLSVPRASPRSAFSWCIFMTHCLPFLVGLGEEQSQGLLQHLASRWIHTSETTLPPASPHRCRVGWLRVRRCRCPWDPGAEGRVLCEGGVLSDVSPPQGEAGPHRGKWKLEGEVLGEAPLLLAGESCGWEAG